MSEKGVFTLAGFALIAASVIRCLFAKRMIAGFASKTPGPLDGDGALSRTIRLSPTLPIRVQRCC